MLQRHDSSQGVSLRSGLFGLADPDLQAQEAQSGLGTVDEICSVLLEKRSGLVKEANAELEKACWQWPIWLVGCQVEAKLLVGRRGGV